jgi:catechol 2,3-dioxygenase-like lactoylglutathione lyase family enzyme
VQLPLDHVVILVTELEAAIADYTALGFTVQRGGTHADGATHNALVGFADGSYLEIIAFLKPASEHRWAHHNSRGHSGFVDFALLPPSVGEVVRAARGRGLAYDGPFDGGRLRPDGERLVWQSGTPTTPDLPFLCGDVTSRALRVREGNVRVHDNGVHGVAAITVAVADLARSVSRYRALLGPAAAAQLAEVPLAGLALQAATLPLGPTTLVLVSNGPAAHGAVASEPGVLAQALGGRGEGVIGLTLRGPRAVALPLAGTHGAVIDIQPAAATES